MKYLMLLTLAILMSSCEKDTQNLISKNRLGNLNNTTKISEIESILAFDSIVIINAKNAYGQ